MYIQVISCLFPFFITEYVTFIICYKTGTRLPTSLKFSFYVNIVTILHNFYSICEDYVSYRLTNEPSKLHTYLTTNLYYIFLSATSIHPCCILRNRKYPKPSTTTVTKANAEVCLLLLYPYTKPISWYDNIAGMMHVKSMNNLDNSYDMINQWS